MTDTVYRVRIPYEVDTGSATAGVGSLAAMLDVLSSGFTQSIRLAFQQTAAFRQIAVASNQTAVALGQISQQLSGMGKITDAALGKPGEDIGRLGEHGDAWDLIADGIEKAYAVGLKFLGVVRDAVSMSVGIGAKLETTQLAVAGMLQAGQFGGVEQSAEGFQQAMQASAEMMAKIREDARILPGTADELMQIFQRSLTPGGRAGLTAAGVEDISAQAMAVGKAFSLPAQMIARSMSGMLGGYVRSNDMFYQKIKGFLPDSGEGFKQLSGEKRVEALLSAFAKFKYMQEEYGKSWDAISSTTEDYGDAVKRAFSTSVFEGMKGILSEINAWYEKNRETINALAVEYGQKLANAIKGAWEWAKKLAEWISGLNLGMIAIEIGTVVAAIETYKVVVGIATTVQWLWNAAMAANPIGLIVASVVILIGALARLVIYYDKVALEAEKAYIVMLKMSNIPTMGAFDPIIRQEQQIVRILEFQLQEKKEQGRDSFVARVKDTLGVDLDFFKVPTRPALPFGPANDPDLFKKILDGKGGIKAKGDTNIGTINNNIHQTVNAAEDPERVFIDMKRAIEMGIHHPTESPSSLGAVSRS